jgi:hypothetical protein
LGGMPTPLRAGVGPVPPSSVWKILPVPMVSQPASRNACGSDTHPRSEPDLPAIPPFSQSTIFPPVPYRVHVVFAQCHKVHEGMRVHVVQHWPEPPCCLLTTLVARWDAPTTRAFRVFRPQSACRKWSIKLKDRVVVGRLPVRKDMRLGEQTAIWQ